MKRFLNLLGAITLSSAILFSSAAATFSDTADSPEAGQITYAVEHGLFLGSGGDQFFPDQPLTRAQAVAVLGRQARISGSPCTVFQDVPTGAYYQNALGWAYQNKLIEGASATQFAPDRPMTHTELAALLSQYLGWLGRTDTSIPAAGSGIVSRAQGAAYFAELDQALLTRDTTIRTHTATDGVELTGKLDLPAGDTPVKKLVLFINGSGPNTYDNRRQSGDLSFRYFDLFAEQFGARDIGFFRWNTRGVSIGEAPPMFDSVDEEIYRTYLPATSVSDIGEWIDVLKQDERLQDAEIWLLGWSEGTIIAPLAVKQFPGQISGLLLAGYSNDRMDEVYSWQQSGASSMVFYCQYFDTDGNGEISGDEFAADPYGVRESTLGNTAFAELDLNGDGVLTADDFAIMLLPGKTAFLDAVERSDDAWLAENYGVRLTSGWFNAHKELAPNRETLLTLDLPIYIFHGTADQNCDVAGVSAIEKSFAEHGKHNLTAHIYEGYDHDLLYTYYAVYGVMPQAFEDLFQCLAAER